VLPDNDHATVGAKEEIMPALKHWKMLNMADISLYPDVFAPLETMTKITSLPADQRQLQEHIRDVDIYYASLFVQVTKDVLDRAVRLKVIVTPTTGTDHIDVAYAAAKGIKILSLKEDTDFLSNVTATAEMAWTLLLAVMRRLPWAFADVQEGRWARDKFRGHQLSGKTLGVLGYGRLGRIVAQYGQAFRMRVLACDVRKVQPEPGIIMTDFDTLLKKSDVISIHVHLTDQNRGLVNAAAFAKMKRGVVVINTSRGAVIDEAAFVQALEAGHVGGAGSDVIDGEWRDDLKQHPLIAYARTHDNLVISPHVGGATYESQRMTAEFTVAKLKKYLEGPHD
jgi:D-3-phosphoglycerate dehydrogenase